MLLIACPFIACPKAGEAAPASNRVSDVLRSILIFASHNPSMDGASLHPNGRICK
jgi:hypothetical protein